MTGFYIAGAAMMLVAALFAALPWLRRRHVAAPDRGASNAAIYRDQMAELEADLANGILSQGEFDHAKHELERRLLNDVAETAATPVKTASARWPGIAAALAVPILAVGLYWKLGNPDAINAPRQVANTEADMEAQLRQIEGMVGTLEQRLQQQPDDVRGWVMLARSYSVLQRFPDAARAFERAVQLAPNDAQLYADYADALAMANGQRLAGKPTELTQKALRLDPNNQKALALAGSAMYEAKRFKEAVKYWEKLLATLPADSPITNDIRGAIAEAQQLGGLAATPTTPSATAPKAAAKVSGRVTLAAALKDQAAPTDTVFVFARAAQGPKMPLAILRMQVKDLPADFSLDDSMAMTPQMTLSNFDSVVIGARVSKSGNAAPQPGDLEGLSAPVKPGAKDIALTIDRVVR